MRHQMRENKELRHKKDKCGNKSTQKVRTSKMRHIDNKDKNGDEAGKGKEKMTPYLTRKR